jgi:four helix bundle protein
MGHKELDVWKVSIEFVSEVYNITTSYPKDELFGITSQIRRAAVSIPSNIAEGAARNHDKEFIQFLYIALGSLAELETQLIISVNLKYLDNNVYLAIEGKFKLLRTQLSGLIRYLKTKK